MTSQLQAEMQKLRAELEELRREVRAPRQLGPGDAPQAFDSARLAEMHEDLKLLRQAVVEQEPLISSPQVADFLGLSKEAWARRYRRDPGLRALAVPLATPGSQRPPELRWRRSQVTKYMQEVAP